MRTLKDLVRAGSLVVAGLALGVSTAWSADIWLEAKLLGPTEYPAGIPTTVPMWGYASCGTGATQGICGAHSVPGPMLDVPPLPPSEGLTIHLINQLTVATSIVIPGQREDGMGAVNPAYKDSALRMKAFTHETPAGGTGDYTWTTLAVGTYLYHSGSHVQVQVPMGLYGGMKHDDNNNRAYPGVNYDYETMLLFSEVDPVLNGAVANGTYGTAPAPTSAIGYRPQYFLINGVAYNPNTTSPIPVVPPGQDKPTALLRLVNAGLISHVPTLQNGFFHLTAEDGHLLPNGGHEQYSAFLAAGKTLDAIWRPTATGIYALYDQRLNDTMLVKMAVGLRVAQSDVYSTPEGQLLTVPMPGVLANDGGGTLTAQLFSPVTVGILNLALDGSFTYQPPVGFSGIATFQYRAFDGAMPSNVVTVTINVTAVNDPPMANPDTATGKSGSPIQIFVLANDTDPDDPNSALRVDSVTLPTNGTVSIAPDGRSVTYTSAAGFGGTAMFNYVARDAAGALSQPATVTVTVVLNSPPVAVADNPPAILEDSPPLVIAVLANDSDPDGDALSVSAVDQPATGGTVTTNGTTVTYTPTPNFSGIVTFLYTVSDGALTSQALVTITVTPVNDAPVAMNDVFLVTRYGTFIVPAPGVLANDSDPEGATLTANLVTGLNLNRGTLILGSDGTVTYTPPFDFVGNQTFTYRASDGALPSATATARLAKLLAVKKAIFTDKPGTAQDKWVFEGKASSFAGTSVTIINGPTLGGTVIATVPITFAGGVGGWKYENTGNPVSLDPSNRISLQTNNGTIFTDVPVTRN